MTTTPQPCLTPRSASFPDVAGCPPLALIHHPGYRIPLPEKHPFPMDKFSVLKRQLDHQLAGYPQAVEWVTPEPADEDDLLQVHTRRYVHEFLTGTLSTQAQRRSGFVWNEALRERSVLAVGGTLATVREALARGLACNTAGGTHHAHPEAASGYCLLNDIGVAARQALDEGVRQVLVVDLDVHQGDGTALIFADEPRVFTLSLHAGSNFPARKQKSDLDVPLPKGMGDEAYLEVLARTLEEVLARVRPELVIFDAGVDPHAADRLGHLELTDAGLYRRERHVIERCRATGAAVACVIGGGYDRDIEALAWRHSQLHRAALDVWREAHGEPALFGPPA
ncbi:histone deacetylase family protein [Cobetia crustatorum]|uniref:histone deacetylase family protein n=1 Tax=Cobetia crustatorum TaxID=553385 RepID=UPI0004B43250|nr:histone deacetylase [Cobetia crustatorum]